MIAYLSSNQTLPNNGQYLLILIIILGIEPFVVGLFCGNKKPPCGVYLYKLGDELNELQHNVVSVNNIDYSVTVYVFVCDAPARTILKGIVNHCGFYLCERCTIVRKSFKSCLFFPTIKKVLF